MKKTIILAALLLLTAGVTRLSAEEEDYYYGFITSCGEEDFVICDSEMDDDECVEWLDWFEYIYCGEY